MAKIEHDPSKASRKLEKEKVRKQIARGYLKKENGLVLDIKKKETSK